MGCSGGGEQLLQLRHGDALGRTGGKNHDRHEPEQDQPAHRNLPQNLSDKVVPDAGYRFWSAD
jgi:hypothetical protein